MDDLSHLSEKELMDLNVKITREFRLRNVSRVLTEAKAKKTFAKYSYYFFNPDMGETLLGFGSEKSGYIDDRVPEEIEDDYHDLIAALNLVECMTCTYEFEPEQRVHIEQVLQELGMQEGEPDWE